MQLLSFNDIDIPDRAVVYEIPAIATVARATVAGARVGGFALGITHPTRRYRVEGVFVRSNTKPLAVDSLIDQLRGAMAAVGVLRQKMRDNTVRRCNAYLVSVNPVHDNVSSATNAQPLALEFESDEFWHDDALTVSDLTSATTLYTVNVGSAATTKLKITITSAIASTLTITNTTNGEALVYGAAKSSGAVLVIDADAGTVTVDGANVYGNTSRADTQIALLSLDAGVNKLTFSAAVTGRVEYRGCWV